MTNGSTARPIEGGFGREEPGLAWRSLALGPPAAEPALTEANLGFLERVAAEAAAHPRAAPQAAGVYGLPAEQAAKVMRLLPAERARLATAPFALFDLRFADAHFWAGILERRAGHPAQASTSRWTRGVTVLGWHLAQRGGLVAALSIGMTPGVQSLWAAMPLGALETVAAAAEEVLTARWPVHPRFWARMLAAIERDDDDALAAVRHLGWQLLATDGLRPTLARRRLPRG